MLVFDAAGQRAHAVEIWHAARAIGEEGNKSARAELRRRYGAGRRASGGSGGCWCWLRSAPPWRGRGAVVGGAIVASAALVALAALATVQDRAADLQRQTADRLGPELAAAIVRIRTAAFAEAPVSPHGLDLARYDDAVPAGGVIISDFADPRVWLPRALADKL